MNLLKKAIYYSITNKSIDNDFLLSSDTHGNVYIIPSLQIYIKDNDTSLVYINIVICILLWAIYIIYKKLYKIL